MRGVFVTGTDTGAGKTVVAAAICAALVARRRARGRVQAGGHRPRRAARRMAAPTTSCWPASTRAGARRGGALRFGPAVSPHWAAELADTDDRPGATGGARPGGRIRASTRCLRGGRRPAGAAHPRLPVRDLAVDLGLPVVVAARPGLGHDQPHAAHGGGGACRRPARGRHRDDALAAIARADRGLQPGRRCRAGRCAVSGLPPTAPDALAEAGAALPAGRLALSQSRR